MREVEYVTPGSGGDDSEAGVYSLADARVRLINDFWWRACCGGRGQNAARRTGGVRDQPGRKLGDS